MARIVNFILDAVAPRKCAGCGKEKEIFCLNCRGLSFRLGASCVFCNQRNNTGRVCRQCRKIYEPGFEKTFWAGEYKNALKSAIWELKYKKRKELASPLAELLYKKFAEFYGKSKKENFTVIPIPMHPKKEYKRGFNQAKLLALKFSKIAGIQFSTSNPQLLKVIDTKTQVETKKKEERIKNLEGAFKIYDPNRVWDKTNSVCNKTIILIDDVATTGATFVHASRAIQKSFPHSKIICLAIAHGR